MEVRDAGRSHGRCAATPGEAHDAVNVPQEAVQRAHPASGVALAVIAALVASEADQPIGSFWLVREIFSGAPYHSQSCLCRYNE